MYINTHTGNKEDDLRTRAVLAIFMTLHYFLKHPEKCGFDRKSQTCRYYYYGNMCAVGKMLGPKLAKKLDTSRATWLNLCMHFPENIPDYMKDYDGNYIALAQRIHDRVADNHVGGSPIEFIGCYPSILSDEERALMNKVLAAHFDRE